MILLKHRLDSNNNKTWAKTTCELSEIVNELTLFLSRWFLLTPFKILPFSPQRVLIRTHQKKAGPTVNTRLKTQLPNTADLKIAI